MKNNVVERVDRLVIVDNGMRELKEGLELKQTRIYGLQMTHFRLGSFFLRWVFV